MEKYYGKANPALVPFLSSEARALRKLGRAQDAESVEKEAAGITAAGGGEKLDEKR